MSRRSQLRIYTVEPTTADEWVKLFFAHLVPLREQYGFSVDWSVLSEDNTRFVWMTSHDCPDGWEAAESTYYASPERSSLPFDPSDYISGHDVSMVAVAPDGASERRGPDHDGQPARAARDVGVERDQPATEQAGERHVLRRIGARRGPCGRRCPTTPRPARGGPARRSAPGRRPGAAGAPRPP